MAEERYKRLGSVKQKELDTNFNMVYEKFRGKALEAGYTGDLKFVKERGKIVIFVVI